MTFDVKFVSVGNSDIDDVSFVICSFFGSLLFVNLEGAFLDDFESQKPFSGETLTLFVESFKGREYFRILEK